MTLTQVDIDKCKSWLNKIKVQFAEKIQPLYQQLDWRWALVGIPRVADIIQTIDYLASLLSSGEYGKQTTCETGGLTLRIQEKFNGGLSFHLDLRVSVDCWDASKLNDSQGIKEVERN